MLVMSSSGTHLSLTCELNTTGQNNQLRALLASPCPILVLFFPFLFLIFNSENILSFGLNFIL
jgi:hypothetical protein